MALLLLSGCSNTGSNGGSGTTSANEEATTLENPVRLDQLGVLPASDSSASSYLLQLTNYSKDKYTLDSVRVIDLDTGKDSILVSVASQACSTVSANGSCSIQLTPHTSQSADVKLEVNLKDKQGKSKTLYQLIRLSSKLNAKTAGIAMVNDVSRIVSEDGNYSLSIPVILGDNYDEIRASNGSLLCNAPGYQAGNSCTYLVSGKASGTGAVVSTRLEGIKSGKVVTVQEANTKVEIGKGAHLLLSHGTVINTPQTSGEITIFNSGNTEAASVALTTTDTNLQLGTAAANPCQATIAAGDSCKVKVDVTGNTNGQGAVGVAYKDGANDHKAVTNVEYTVANAEAGVKFTQVSSDLENALIGGKTRIAEIKIENTSNRSLKNIKYYLAPANGDFKVVAGTDPACGLDGKHTLDAGGICLVKIEYKPTSEKTGGSINLVLNGKYTDQYGQEHSLVKEHGLSYSATKAGPLSWKQSSGNHNLVILSNDADKKEAIWDLSNTIAADEGLSATLSSDIALNPNDIVGLSVAAEPAGGCGTGAAIDGNAKCSYKVTYGPVSAEQAQKAIALQAKYNLGGEEQTTDSSIFKVQASATPIAGIKTSVTVKKSPTALSGNGSSATPYSFTALSNNTLELEYLFQNESGYIDATAFNVTTGNLPKGASVTGSDCPIGEKTSTLAAGSSCTTTVSVPNPSLFNAPNLTDSPLNGQMLNMVLPYSYSDGGKVIVEDEPDNRINVKFNRLWGTVNSTQQSVTEESGNYKIVVDTVVNVEANTPGVSYPLTVKPTLTNGISGVNLPVNLPSCEIANSSVKTCTTTLSLPNTHFAPGSDVIINYEVSGNTMAQTDHIKANTKVTIPGADLMALQIDAQYAPVWSTNAPSDIRLQAVQFPGNGGIIQIKNTGKLTVAKGSFEPKGDGYYIWKDNCNGVDLAPQASCNLEVVAVRTDSQTLRLQDMTTGLRFKAITTTLPGYNGSKNAADWPSKVKVQKFPLVKITAKAGQMYQADLTPEGNDHQGFNLGEDWNNNTRTFWEWAIQKSGEQETVVDYDVQTDSDFFAQISGDTGNENWARRSSTAIAQNDLWQKWTPDQSTIEPSGSWEKVTAKEAARAGFASAKLKNLEGNDVTVVSVARLAALKEQLNCIDKKLNRRIRVPGAQGPGAINLAYATGGCGSTHANGRYNRLQENLLQGRGLAPIAPGVYTGLLLLGTTQTKSTKATPTTTWNRNDSKGVMAYTDWLKRINPKIEPNTLYRAEIPIELTVVP